MARTAAAVVVGVLALVLMPLATPSASAAPPGTPRRLTAFTLNMVEGEGTLTLRGGEPYEIENPTSIAGTVNGADPDPEASDPGTGAITGGTFTTPEINLQQEITSPVQATVYIDATFRQVTENNLTGTADRDGNVFVQTSLAVDLHVDVGRDPTILSADCTSSPVNLALNSVLPYDPLTQRVTLAQNNFTIPPVVPGGDCESNVAAAVNEQLAGAGHAISLTLEGALALPVLDNPDTITTLDVAPAEGSRVGQDVTMTATVVADPEDPEGADGDPAGFIDFRDGSQVLATVPLETDGTAAFTTAELPAGTRALAARFKGDDTEPNLYDGSTSDQVDYVISANPALTWDLPAFVQIAGSPTDFSVSATNTGLGTLLENARLDVTIQRAEGTAPIGPTGGNPRITLDQVDGSDVTPIPLTFSGSGSNQRLAGSIGAGTGVPLPPGASITETLRLGLPAVGTVSPTACGSSNRLCPGPLRITFSLRLVDPGTGTIVDTVAEDAGQALMIEAARRVTTINAGNAGIPPFVPPTPAIAPFTVRAGNAMTLNQLSIGPTTSGVQATGTVAFSIDGKSVAVLPAGAGTSAGYSTEAVCCRSGSFIIPVPPDTPAGTRTLTLRYSGDSLFQPGLATFTFEVVPQVAPIFECERPALGVTHVARANIVAQGSLPAVVSAGSEVSAVNPVLRMLLDRGTSTTTGGSSGPTLPDVINTFTSLDVGYSVEGTSSSSGITRTNDTRMDAAGDPDQVWAFNDVAMSVTIDGEPGEVVPVTISSFRINFASPGGAMTCTAVGAPISLGQVTVAGTELAVSPEGSVRSGDEVTLEASTAPSSGGVIEFRDGTTTVGVVPVDGEGKASMTTTTLASGERSLTARYFGGLTTPLTTSDPVALTVIPVDCAPFAEPGNGNVVRLVYMELLHRCPDQAGYDHWKALLDGGTSRESFARSISGSVGAQRVLVSKAYNIMLEREPDIAGRDYWVARLQGGYRYDNLLASLGGSGEFYAKGGGTDVGFVTRLYQRLLLRAPDAPGLEHWLDQLEDGKPRWWVALAFTSSGEVRGRLVKDAYEDMLDRQPNPDELAAGKEHMRTTGDLDSLYAQLIALQEFYDRAQERPNFDIV